MVVLTVIALISSAVLARLRPRLALGVMFFLIPFGHLVRFSIAGIPFTFPEAAVYVLAGVLVLHHLFSSFRASREPKPRAEAWREKSHTIVQSSSGVRSFVSLRMTRWCGDPWIVLPVLWILVATIAAIGSPAGDRAWGIWKAYFLAPVLLFWIVCRLFLLSMHDTHASSSSFRASCEPKPRAGAWREKSHTMASPNNDVRSLGSGLGMTKFFSSHLLLLPLALGAFVVAALAVAQRWWPIGVPYPWSLPGKFRATSVFGYPNAVGLFLAPLIPLLIGAIPFFSSSSRAARSAVERSHAMVSTGYGVRSFASLRTTKLFTFSARGGFAFGEYFFLLTSALSLLAIILAKSTGALIALAVAFLTCTALVWWAYRCTPNKTSTDYTEIHDRKNRCSPSGDERGARRWAMIVGGVWVVISLALTAWLPYRHEQPRWGPPIVQKLTFQKWSGSVRLAQYRETWQLLRDHPIRGAGLAGYQTAIAPYHTNARVEIFLYPHNLLLAVWVELGLAGVLVFLTILYQCFRALFSPPHDGRGSARGWGLQAGLVAAMLVVLVHGFVDVPYFKNDLAMLFWMIVAITMFGKKKLERVRATA